MKLLKPSLRHFRFSLPLKSLPVSLLVAVFGLVAYGAVYVTSAAGVEEKMMATKHLLWAALGLTAFLVVFSFDFRFYLDLCPWFYLMALLALVAVLATHPVKGARSWFSLPGGVKIQPSEFAKIAYVLLMARYLSTTREILNIKDLIAATAVMMAPVGLILLQTDLGTSMTFVPVIMIGVFVAGARLWHLGAIGASGVGAVMFLWNVIDTNRKTRVYAWLDPEPYKLEQGYQLIQSQIAIGSGGLWGKGLGLGTQNQFDLLPLKESDFVFAVVAEEGGFLLASVMLLLLVFMVLSGTLIAMRARDRQGQMLAACCTAMLGGQALINIGVTLGLLPTTGITLPFVSYGGSSMITSFVLVGLLANVAARPREKGIFG